MKKLFAFFSMLAICALMTSNAYSAGEPEPSPPKSDVKYGGKTPSQDPQDPQMPQDPQNPQEPQYQTH